MSVDASIDFSFGPQSDAELMLKALLASRWNSGNGEWPCVPLGSDASEWLVTRGEEAVLEILRSKLVRHEVFGVQLFWDGTGIGGEFLVFSNQRASFIATIHRVKLDERTSDVSWYLQRLLPPLTRARRVHLESWVWSETS